MGVFTLKNLIILGVPRSGKTTLAKEVIGLFSADNIPVSFLSADSVIGGITEIQKNNVLWRVFVRPIRHIVPGLRQQTKKDRIDAMVSFVARFINETSDVVPVVYEGAYIAPEIANKIFNKKKCVIVVIGYPNCSVDEKIRDIKKFDKQSPFIRKPDGQLETLILGNIERSKKMQKAAEKYGFMFVDTSQKYHQTIKSAAQQIYEKLSK